MLPKDAVILLSVVNTFLRDKYLTLSALCEDLDVDEAELKKRLFEIGYEYSAEQNRFV